MSFCKSSQRLLNFSTSGLDILWRLNTASVNGSICVSTATGRSPRLRNVPASAIRMPPKNHGFQPAFTSDTECLRRELQRTGVQRVIERNAIISSSRRCYGQSRRGSPITTTFSGLNSSLVASCLRLAPHIHRPGRLAAQPRPAPAIAQCLTRAAAVQNLRFQPPLGESSVGKTRAGDK
jgi:hypothetical protein